MRSRICSTSTARPRSTRRFLTDRRLRAATARKARRGAFSGPAESIQVLSRYPLAKFLERGQDFFRMAVDLDLGEDLSNRAVAIDDQRSALDSHVLAAVERFLFVDAERACQF